MPSCVDQGRPGGQSTDTAHILLPGPSDPEADSARLTSAPGTFYPSGWTRKKRSLWVVISTRHQARLEFFPKALSFHPHAK